MVEQGLRGGISMVSRRFARSNIPGMKKWKPNKGNKSILYLDANNLYGWAMMQYLPTGGFHWIRDKEILEKLQKEIENGNIPEDNPKGFILKVKLRYPEHLHPSHTE